MSHARPLRLALATLAAVAAVAGCGPQPTRFLGEAKVPGGPAGCRARCEGWGLDFAGMVAMGDYSDGCICQVPGKAVTPGAAGQAAAEAGVLLQERRAEENARRHRDGMWNRPGMRTR